MIGLFDNQQLAEKFSAIYPKLNILLHSFDLQDCTFMTPYKCILKNFKLINDTKPLFFADIKLSNFESINLNGHYGEIFDFGSKKANVTFFEPNHLKHVSTIEYLTNQGHVLTRDYYNYFGEHYARENYNVNEELVSTTYYDHLGREVILKNYNFNKEILIHINNTVKTFHSEREVFNFCYNNIDKEIKDIVLTDNERNIELLSDKTKMYYVAYEQKLDAQYIDHIFNMGFAGIILYENINLYKEICENNSHIYHISEKMELKNPKRNQHIAIVTNSQYTEQLEHFIATLPNFHFHIAAPTIMGELLTNLDAYDNVTLYQNASEAIIDQIISKCSIYLDVNYHNEVYHAIKKAFCNNSYILGFDVTIKNKVYTNKENIFAIDDIDKMVCSIQAFVAEDGFYQQIIQTNSKLANEINQLSLKLNHLLTW
ncbi:TPA: hypothetical protein ACGO28_001457 [Streptococcus suis]